jgi:hypothetical protein
MTETGLFILGGQAMTLCRSRGEPGRVRHRGEQLQHRLWCSARCSPSSHAFVAETQSAGRSKPQVHCLALEGSRLDLPDG